MPSAPKRLLTGPFTCSVTACGLNTKAAPLRLALSISKSATRRFSAPLVVRKTNLHGTTHLPGSCRQLAALYGMRCYHRRVPGKSPFGSFKPTRRSCASPCVKYKGGESSLTAEVQPDTLLRTKLFEERSQRGRTFEVPRLFVPGAPPSYRAGEQTCVSRAPNSPCNHKHTASVTMINLETAGG